MQEERIKVRDARRRIKERDARRKNDRERCKEKE